VRTDASIKRMEKRQALEETILRKFARTGQSLENSSDNALSGFNMRVGLTGPQYNVPELFITGPGAGSWMAAVPLPPARDT